MIEVDYGKDLTFTSTGGAQTWEIFVTKFDSTAAGGRASIYYPGMKVTSVKLITGESNYTEYSCGFVTMDGNDTSKVILESGLFARSFTDKNNISYGEFRPTDWILPDEPVYVYAGGNKYRHQYWYSNSPQYAHLQQMQLSGDGGEGRLIPGNTYPRSNYTQTLAFGILITLVSPGKILYVKR